MVSKTWTFTLNNYQPEEEMNVRGLEANYICYGKEIAATGTPHLQGYVTFQTAKRLSGVRTLIPRAHWEIARKNELANRRYCSKEGNFWEKRKAPVQKKVLPHTPRGLPTLFEEVGIAVQFLKLPLNFSPK